LEEWYRCKCDGAWEHSHGVRLDTIDNPGWRVEVDIGPEIPDVVHEEQRTDLDWISCRVEQGRSSGADGPANLAEILVVLQGWLD